jgi:thioredoxin reductase (NADPH)
VKAYFQSTVKEITQDAVVISTPDGTVTIKNDFVLAMTGYQPPFEFMESMGIKFLDDEDHTPVYNETTMETNVDGIYLAGVVCGGLRTNKWFIENSRVHANLIAESLKKKRAEAL